MPGSDSNRNWTDSEYLRGAVVQYRSQRRRADTGRTDQHHHGTRSATAGDLQAPFGPAVAHGQVFDDAVLAIVESVVIGVEDRARTGDVGGVVGLDAPRPFQDYVQPRSDPTGFGRLVAGTFELPGLAERGLADGLRQIGGLDTSAVIVGTFGLVLTEFLADGVGLPTQQEILLLLLHSVADVVDENPKQWSTVVKSRARGEWRSR